MFANLSLKSRLWVLGLVSVMGIATIAMSSVWHAYSSKEMLIDFIDNTVAINHSSTTSYANGLQMGQALRNILLDPANKKAYDNFAAANKEFGVEIDQMASLLAKVNGGNAVAATLKGKIEQWQPLQQQIIDQVKGGNNTEALALLVNKETPAWRALKSDLLDIVKRSETDGEQARTKLLNSLDTTRTLAIVLSLVSFFLVVTIALFVSRGIFHQVGGEPAYAAEKLQQIAEGDLTHPVAVSHGDTKSIIAAMSSMQSQIRQVISGTVSCANSVVQESEAIRDDAARLSQTAESQSSATSAIASAVEQLTVSISVMSANANDAGRLSSQSAQQAHNSLEVVSVATDTIQKVSDGMTEASVTMEKLSREVTNISGIVQTIEDIASQTNLLALNAAIEAARAGELGRGFAVVADEVRKLAERTTTSTHEVSTIVDGIRQTTDTALETMSRAKELSMEGATHTEAIRNAVMAMDESSVSVSKVVESIAEALREQSAASSDIAQRVELIAQGIEQTHAASSESSRRSTVLVDLSHTLKGAVSGFRI